MLILGGNVFKDLAELISVYKFNDFCYNIHYYNNKAERVMLSSDLNQGRFNNYHPYTINSCNIGFKNTDGHRHSDKLNKLLGKENLDPIPHNRSIENKGIESLYPTIRTPSRGLYEKLISLKKEMPILSRSTGSVKNLPGSDKADKTEGKLKIRPPINFSKIYDSESSDSSSEETSPLLYGHNDSSNSESERSEEDDDFYGKTEESDYPNASQECCIETATLSIEDAPIESPKINFAVESMKELATGNFKIVYECKTYEKIPGSTYSRKLGTPKEFVYIEPKNNSNKTIRAINLEVEILKKINELLKKDSENNVRSLFVKNYVIHEKSIIAKKANLGEAKEVMGEISPKEKALVMLNVIQGLKFLHSHGIIHNDIAPRNILVHYSRDVIKLDQALNRIIGNDVVISGTVIVKKGTVLTKSDIEVLKKNHVEKLKVFSEEVKCRGMLSDFGCASYLDTPNITQINHPRDIVAPEVFMTDDYDQKAADAFSLGQTLIDVFLYGNRDSDVSIKSDYTEMALKRFEERSKKFESLKSKKFSCANIREASALEPEEYLRLKKIDKDLAEIILRLMSYNPMKRPALKEVEKIFLNLTL